MMTSTCLVCLSTGVDTIQWDTLLCNDVTYEDVFYHCTQFQRVYFDKFNKICATCESELKIIYKFIEKAKDSFQKINEANTDENRDENLDNFEVEFLEADDINFEILNESNDSEQPFKEILDNMHETDYCQDSKSSIDELCEEEFLLETREDHNSDQFVLDKSDTKVNNVEHADNICEYCGKCLSNKSTKARHIDRMHDTSSNVLCDKCPKTFKNKFSLAKHRKIHHQNRERNYACKYCNQKFFTGSNCRSHEETHVAQREKKHKCDQCEKAFFHRGALNVHKRMHTGQMEQCLICGKRYPRLVDLKIHMRGHTMEQPFACDLCENKFVSSSALGLHMRKDHLGFKYNCTTCSKRFKTPEQLKEHKVQHNTFPYVCGICNTSFLKRFLLHRHLKRVHTIFEDADLKQYVIVAKK